MFLLRRPETERSKPSTNGARCVPAITGPVKAKSVEDTAFYRYSRLACLNEVGSDPSKFGWTIEEFHAQNAERASSWPLGMVTTSTHDSKRGEDTSARIAVISEIPDVWQRALRAWTEMAAQARHRVDYEAAPSRGLEYLFYQTLIGAWPYGWDGVGERGALTERLSNFLTKASKEAKQETSWTSPHPEYDTAVRQFVASMLNNDLFVAGVRKVCEAIAPHAASNGLGQTLLRLCSPGVPDTYQGSEVWNQSLVDPDNRRPVDFAARRRALDEIIEERARDARALAQRLLESYTDGRIKLYVTHVALTLRKSAPDVFVHGDYEPILGGEHVVAFTRGTPSQRIICCVTRLSHKQTGGASEFAVGAAWGRETLRVAQAGRYVELLTNRQLDVGHATPLSTIFQDLPVALLLQQEKRRRA